MHLSIANKNWSADLFQVNVAMCIELCQVHCACLHLIFFGSAELLLSLLSDLHRSWASGSLQRAALRVKVFKLFAGTKTRAVLNIDDRKW